MPNIDIFNDDAFSLSTLTAAINKQPHQPGRISALNLFEEEGITTTTVQIEKDTDTLSLVAAGHRGSSGQVVNGSKRTLVPFNTLHLMQRATIMADEVQGLRAFGSETELESVTTLVNKRLTKFRRQLDATIEFHRIGAIKGQILDADGQHVLLNLFERFGLKQKTVAFDLSNPKTELRIKCLEVLEAIEDALGAATFSGVRVFCGRDFWAKLMQLDSFKETYLNSEMAAALRGEPREAIEFGGCVFERYRGKSAASPLSPTTKPTPSLRACRNCLSPASPLATICKPSTPTACRTRPHKKSCRLTKAWNSKANPTRSTCVPAPKRC